MLSAYGIMCCFMGYEATTLSGLTESQHFKACHKLSCKNTVISSSYVIFSKLRFSGPHPGRNVFYTDANRVLSHFLCSPYLGCSWIPACTVFVSPFQFGRRYVPLPGLWGYYRKAGSVEIDLVSRASDLSQHD